MNTSKTDDIRSYLDWAPKGRSAWWVFVIGIVVLAIILFVVTALYGGLLVNLMGSFRTSSEVGHIIFTGLVFLPAFLTPPLLAWALHKRPWWSVAFPRPRVEWWNFGIGAFFSLLTVTGIWIFNSLFWGIKVTFMPPAMQDYLPYVLAAIFFVFIQTTSEELVYRGYVMQAVYRITANPILVIVLTGLAFGIPHYPNLAGLGWPWYGVFVYILDGSMLAWLGYRTRSLWMPIGWHWANNFILFTLLSVKTDGAKGLSFLSADNYPAVGLTLLNKIILYALMAFIINRLVSRREKAGGQ